MRGMGHGTTTSFALRPSAVGVRVVAAAVAVVPMVLVMLWVDSMFSVYAVHLCRWPATISCRDGWQGWELASAWFWVFGVVSVSAVALWVIRGSVAMRLWAVVPMIMAFPVVVLASGPRLLGVGDLFVFGVYSTCAVVLSWQVLSEWLPAARRALAVMAVAIAVLQLGAIAATPMVLADVAERNGLTRSP